MSKVFILNKSDIHDYSAASVYGELVAITEGPVPIFKIDTIVDMLSKGLADVTEDDFILLSGHSLLVAIATMVITAKYPVFKVLVFDAKQSKYVARHIKYNIPVGGIVTCQRKTKLLL